MVGRLIENQKVCPGQHQLGKGKPSPLSSGQIGYQLEYIVPGEKKGGQRIPDLCIVQIRVCVLELLKQCLIRMKNLVLLVLVPDIHIRSGYDLPFVRFHTADQDFQKRGLSGPVVSDQRNLFPALNLQIQVLKQRKFKGF